MMGIIPGLCLNRVIVSDDPYIPLSSREHWDIQHRYNPGKTKYYLPLTNYYNNFNKF